MISAPVSSDTPKASLCSAYQGSSSGGGQKEGTLRWRRAPSKQLPGTLPLCHISSSPPWMVRGVALAFAPSLAPLIPAQQPRAQSTMTAGGEEMTAGVQPASPHPKWA